MQKDFYSNGKLLITGEYAVLDGTKALAIPTKYGQGLTVKENNSGYILWKSFDFDENIWFETKLSIPDLKVISTSNKEISNTLQNILSEAQALNDAFLSDETGLAVLTNLSFPKHWGLGTSSTLINNIADWAIVDAYDLLERTFGGSGYDLACAKHNKPIVYQLNSDKASKVIEVDFRPSFIENLYFIYLNKKQDSREAIQNYRNQVFDKGILINKISEITKKVIIAQTISEFEALLREHESILSEVLHVKTVQEKLFSDYQGAVKSLGGWGGDFILATGNEKTPEYFKSKGFEVIIPYQEMVL